MGSPRLALAALTAALTLVAAAPAAADLLPPLTIEPPPIQLPPLDVLAALPTHGVDPLAISIALEVPGPSGGASGAPLDTGVTVDADAVRRSEPTAWCGEERGSDDTEHALSNGDFHYHAIYAVPSDAPDRLRSVADGLQADAFQASGLIERLYGRAIRLDLGTNCGPQYLDITTVRLQHSTAQLQALTTTTNATYSTVLDDLEQAGFPTVGAGDVPSDFTGQSNYLVWLDGPAPAGCGQGAFYNDTRRDPANDNNGGGRVAIVFRPGTDFCNSNAARHEVGHNLGAVQQPAPHSDGGGHCNDTPGDTMCLTSTPTNGDTFQSLYFDAHDDDYWGSLPWWTVDLSRFICPEIACNVPGGLAARQVATTGGGSGYSPTGSGTSRPRATLTATHRGTRWRFRVRVRGSGRARVTVTCRRAGHTRRLLRRTVKAPAMLKGRGRCDRRPRVSVRALAARAGLTALR